MAKIGKALDDTTTTKKKSTLKDFIYDPTSASLDIKANSYGLRNSNYASNSKNSGADKNGNNDATKSDYLTTLIQDDVLHQLMILMLVKKTDQVLFDQFLKIFKMALDSKNLIMLTSMFYRNNLFGFLNQIVDEMQHKYGYDSTRSAKYPVQNPS